MMKKYDWLFFDLDNTILDFNASSKLAFFELFKSRNILFDESDYQSYNEINHKVWQDMEKGLYDHKVVKSKRWNLFLESKGISGDGEVINKEYFDIISKHRIFVEGAENIVIALAKEYKLCLVTNGIAEVQIPRLANADLNQYFEAVIISDVIGFAKPDKAFFDYTSKKLNNPAKDRVLMIGDNLNSDILGASNYGYDTCWFDYHKKGEAHSIATYYINQIIDLKAILIS